MKYHSLATKNECLIIFLHHNNKRSEYAQPSKNNIVGSQGFEAKMRSVIEIRKSKGNVRHMVLLKCNFLPQKYKEIRHVLEFDEKTLLFSNTNSKIPINSGGKSEDPDTIKKVLKYRKNGLSIRGIEAKLKGTKYKIGRTAINKIIKK